jgi:hypothetical protein
MRLAFEYGVLKAEIESLRRIQMQLQVTRKHKAKRTERSKENTQNPGSKSKDYSPISQRLEPAPMNKVKARLLRMTTTMMIYLH